MDKATHTKESLETILERAELRLSLISLGNDCNAILHQYAVVERLKQMVKEAATKCKT